MYGILWYPCKPAIVTHLCPKCAPNRLPDGMENAL